MPPDAAPAVPPGTPAAPPAAPPTTWYEGVPAETVTYWNTKGLNLSDPKEFALQLTGQFRDTAQYIGVPADQLLRLPQQNWSEADHKAFRSKLGVPEQASDYGLKSMKFADGGQMDGEFADVLATALLAGGVSKEGAMRTTSELIAYETRKISQTAAANQLRLNEQKELLKKDWGNQYDLNLAVARVGANRLQISNEMLDALLDNPAWGEYKTMELFRRIGAGSGEDSFAVGSQATGTPTTATTAQMRLNELQADPEWCRKLTAQDAATMKEFQHLTRMISGYVPELEGAA